MKKLSPIKITAYSQKSGGEGEEEEDGLNLPLSPHEHHVAHQNRLQLQRQTSQEKLQTRLSKRKNNDNDDDNDDEAGHADTQPNQGGGIHEEDTHEEPMPVKRSPSAKKLLHHIRSQKEEGGLSLDENGEGTADGGLLLSDDNDEDMDESPRPQTGGLGFKPWGSSGSHVTRVVHHKQEHELEQELVRQQQKKNSPNAPKVNIYESEYMRSNENETGGATSPPRSLSLREQEIAAAEIALQMEIERIRSRYNPPTASAQREANLSNLVNTAVEKVILGASEGAITSAASAAHQGESNSKSKIDADAEESISLSWWCLV